ncbi:hypothetical protein BT69DRAFT_142170 [Atractiella rhizophila]|nr:hypothetical protein BT69DRAFT_142170 [Atractiella rhizophila]
MLPKKPQDILLFAALRTPRLRYLLAFPRHGMASNYSTTKITLTPGEAQISTLLKECTEHLKKEKPDLAPIEIRLAGGWVRDKLLGLQSNDLDVAISTMTGEKFGKLFYNYLKSQEEKSPMKIARIQTIMANPEKSKHLETAHTVLLDHEIDFAHLRSEVYEESSRIPKEFGTPLQDAERRDFTINSLFYNVHSEEVEDFTGKGLQDLEDRVIRTPLDPRETFKDDPLRILRGIRFCSRFKGFKLDKAIEEAAKEENIRIALEQKISRERVGIELDKMLEGPSPVLALRLIEDFKLYNIVYNVPSSIKTSFKPSNSFIASKIPSIRTTTPPTVLTQAIEKLHSFINLTSDLHPLLQHNVDLIKGDKALRRRMFLAVSMLPLIDTEFEEKKRTKWIGDKVMTESLKRSNDDRDFVLHLFARYREAESKKLSALVNAKSQRSEVGQLLRSLKRENPNGPSWTETLVFSMTLDCVLLDVSEAEIVKAYNDFCAYVDELKLVDPKISEGTAFEDCRLNGSEIQTILNTTGGPHLQKLKTLLLNYQLDNPKVTKEELVDWLKEGWEMETGEIRDVRKEAEMRGVKRKK